MIGLIVTVLLLPVVLVVSWVLFAIVAGPWLWMIWRFDRNRRCLNIEDAWEAIAFLPGKVFHRIVHDKDNP